MNHAEASPLPPAALSPRAPYDTGLRTGHGWSFECGAEPSIPPDLYRWHVLPALPGETGR